MADTVVIPNTGLDITTNRIIGNGTEPNYVGWGTGTTTPVVTDTALETESAEARVTGTSSQQTTNTTDDTYRVVGEMTSASTQDISEVGLLDASTSGNLFVRATFTKIPLATNDQITFTIDVAFDQA